MRWMLVAVVVLAGCATTAGYDRMLDEWVGESESHLISVWGPPTSRQEASMGSILIYERARQAQQPSVIAPGSTQRSPMMVYGGGTEMRQCRTSFWVHEGRVISWRRDGDDCRM